MPAPRKRHAKADQASASPDAGWEHRLETLEARMEHLERQLEGLQDAVYRRAMREDQDIGDLRRRMEPDQMARELERDARKRGLR